MFLKSISRLFLLVIIALAVSCGRSDEQKAKDAILEGNILLSTFQCQEAIDLLEGVGRQNRNAKYLKVLSSAYACRAGYTVTEFFGTDVKKTASPAPLGGMTTYSTSTVTVTAPLINDSNFKDLQTAIDILLYAGGISSTTEPTTTERAKYFTTTEAGEINSQLAFMLLVQTGKLMQYYSNASNGGVKGAGTISSNTCFTDYSATPAALQTVITSGAVMGACTSTTDSHTELAIGANLRQRKLCQGVVLFNSILNVLPSVLASAGGGDLSAISAMEGQITAQKNKLLTYDPTFSSTAVVLSQTNCETNTDITPATLSSYYAVFYETLVQ